MVTYEQHIVEIHDMIKQFDLSIDSAYRIDAACDLLTDDGVAMDKALAMSLTAEQMGKSAEDFARHFIKLRKAVQ